MVDSPPPADGAGQPAANPYLRGNFAPVTEELTVDVPLGVDGAIPPGLEGMYVRNGPNPAVVDDPAAYHWFSGDGMVHAVELSGGRAVGYRNRWVRTRKLAAEIGTRPPAGPVEPVDGPANTHVVLHGGRLLALVESGLPHRLATDLSTIGVEDFDGALGSPMTAHPKVDPDTGALVFFGYDCFGPPYLRVHEMAPDGTLVHSTAVDLPRAVMVHDAGVTATRMVLLDLPVVADEALALAGRPLPFRWDPGAGARVGCLDRRARGDQVRWTAIDPCFVFHVANAYDDGRQVVLDVVRYDTAFDTDPGGFIGSTLGTLERWRLDPDTGRVEATRLDDRPVEFPRVDDSLAGRPHRYVYCVEVDRCDGTEGFGDLVRYDLARDEAVRHRFGPGRSAGEPVFVRDPEGRADDEGWVLTLVHDAGRGGTDLVVLDASSPAAEPEAVVHLPARVPFGFHGSWLPAERYR